MLCGWRTTNKNLRGADYGPSNEPSKQITCLFYLNNNAPYGCMGSSYLDLLQGADRRSIITKFMITSQIRHILNTDQTQFERVCPNEVRTSSVSAVLKLRLNIPFGFNLSPICILSYSYISVGLSGVRFLLARGRADD